MKKKKIFFLEKPYHPPQNFFLEGVISAEQNVFLQQQKI